VVVNQAHQGNSGTSPKFSIPWKWLYLTGIRTLLALAWMVECFYNLGLTLDKTSIQLLMVLGD